MDDSPHERILLVDGNNYVMRALHAAKAKMSSDDGVLTGGLMLFVNMLSKLIRSEKPHKVMVCFDGGRSKYRTSLYPEYKLARNDAVSLPQDSFELVKRFLNLCNIPYVRCRGIEADDLIAWYWAHQYFYQYSVIASGDKDFLQLVDENTVVLSPTGDRWTTQRVLDEKGCFPIHLSLAMALTGDKVDGIPGIDKVGPVTAVKLLRKYGWSLKALLDSDESKVIGQRELVMRNLALIDLRTSGLVFAESLPDLERFSPTDSTSLLWDDLSAFLDMYQLKTIKEKLEHGRLWTDPIKSLTSDRSGLDPRLFEDLGRFADSSSDFSGHRTAF